LTEQPDGAEQQWELAGSFRGARDGRGWTFVGGWEEDDAVGLRLVVHHPTDPELVRRVSVRVPVTVGPDGTVELGRPEEVPDE
jgi:hypothetical protein